MSGPNLTQVASFLKSRWSLLIFLLFVVVVALLVFVIQELTRSRPQNTWRGLTPGKTKVSELGKILGQPASERREEEKVIYQYQSGNQFSPHEVVTEKEEVVLIREEVFAEDKRTLRDFQNRLGRQDVVLYGQHGIAAPLYLFAKAGVGVFANPKSGRLVEIWYFSPTTVQGFLSQFPSQFSTTIPKKF